MKKYTQEEIKKFLDPKTRFHMSSHVIQTDAVQICKQIKTQLDVAMNALMALSRHDEAYTAFKEVKKLGGEQ